MRYISDLRIGRINPQHFKFGLRVGQKKYDRAQLLRGRILTTPNPEAAFDEAEPPFADYRRTGPILRGRPTAATLSDSPTLNQGDLRLLYTTFTQQIGDQP
jgi:hypothetical protein